MLNFINICTPSSDKCHNMMSWDTRTKHHFRGKVNLLLLIFDSMMKHLLAHLPLQILFELWWLQFTFLCSLCYVWMWFKTSSAVFPHDDNWWLTCVEIVVNKLWLTRVLESFPQKCCGSAAGGNVYCCSDVDKSLSQTQKQKDGGGAFFKFDCF